MVLKDNGSLIEVYTFGVMDFLSFNIAIKMKGFQSYEKFCFLVPCRLTDITQDIGVGQFDSYALIKRYSVGVSV